MMENSVGSVSWVIHRKTTVMWSSGTFFPAAEMMLIFTSITQIMKEDRRNGLDSSRIAEK